MRAGTHLNNVVLGAYSEREITQMNREHDRRYGWSPKFPMLYTKPDATCTVVTRTPKECYDELWLEIVGIFELRQQPKVEL